MYDEVYSQFLQRAERSLSAFFATEELHAWPAGLPDRYCELKLLSASARFKPCFGSLALCVAGQLALGPPARCMVRDRLYLIGSLATRNGPEQVFFARGCDWSDGAEMLNDIQEGAASSVPLVVVPSASFLTNTMSPPVCTVLSLTELSCWDEARQGPDFSSLRTFLHRVFCVF